MVTIRRQFRLFQAYTLVVTLALVFLVATAFRQPSKAQNLGEITVERINVVDANGTLRLVISNKDRMHPGVIDGHTINRARPVAGLLFFNDMGDEVGGLVTQAMAKDGRLYADSGLTFDQLKQDQVIGVGYTEGNGARSASLKVWDRPDASLGILIDKANAVEAITDQAKRSAAMNELKSIPRGKLRMTAGRDDDRSVGVTLNDPEGRTRARLKVDAAGAPSLEFLDENGKVIERLPGKR